MSVMRAPEVPEAWAQDRIFTVEDLEGQIAVMRLAVHRDGPGYRGRGIPRGPAVPGHGRAGRPCGNGFWVTPGGAGRA
jgi:hypothetical protein